MPVSTTAGTARRTATKKTTGPEPGRLCTAPIPSRHKHTGTETESETKGNKGRKIKREKLRERERHTRAHACIEICIYTYVKRYFYVCNIW